MKAVQKIHYGLVLALVCALVGQARASSVVYEDFDVVSHESIFTTPFSVSTPGTYRALLVDFEYPDPFEILSLAITQDGNPLGIGFGTGSFTFNVATPGTLLAHLAAVPAAGGQGVYGLQVLPVPLPPAIWLFLSALTGIVAVGRRGSGVGAAA